MVWMQPGGTGGDTESKVAPADFQKISLNMDLVGSTCPQLNISALFAGGWTLLGSQLSLSEKGPWRSKFLLYLDIILLNKGLGIESRIKL